MSLMVPAVSLMGRLSYARKFLFVTVLFLVPLVISVVFLQRKMGEDIAFWRSQLAGLPQVEQLLSAQAAFGAAMESVQRRDNTAAATHFEQMVGRSQAAEALGKRSSLLAAGRSDWPAVAELIEAPLGGEEQLAISTALRGSILRVSADSKLLFASDPTAHYLVEALVNRVPELTAASQFAGTFGQQFVDGLAFNPERFIRLSNYTDDLSRAVTALAENARDLRLLANPATQDVEAALARVEDTAMVLRDTIKREVLDSDSIVISSGEYRAAYEAAIRAQQDLLALQANAVEELLSQALSQSRATMLMTLGVLSFMLLAVVYLFIGFYVSVRRTIDSLSADFGRLASGDLSRGADTEAFDEMSNLVQAFNDMSERFRALVGAVVSSTAEVAATSDLVDQHAGHSSQTIRDVKSALDDTGRQMTALADALDNAARQTGVARELSAATSDQVKLGETVVGQTVESMQRISESSRRVVNIIGVIDDIAFQTNLLALNASVEAARAGEQGRGFAVVASEVRALALRSAEAAQQVKGLVQESAAVVEEGRKLVESSGETFAAIQDSATNLDQIIAEITALSEEQSRAIETANRSLDAMAASSEENATMVDQTVAASARLAVQAQSTETLAATFRTT